MGSSPRVDAPARETTRSAAEKEPGSHFLVQVGEDLVAARQLEVTPSASQLPGPCRSN